MSDTACQVPLVEQLRSVPAKHRLELEIQWAEDGTPTGHHLIPVGHLAHRAADALAIAQSRVAKLEREVETTRMQLAAISNASFENTPASAAKRIGREHPYWTPAYADVCAAVDREMRLRALTKEEK